MMRNNYLLRSLLIFGVLTINVFGQKTVVINNPTDAESSPPPPVADYKLIENQILPKLRKRWTTETCTEEFEVKGSIKGSFTKSNANQTLFFAQFCQNGNGLGNNFLVLIEDEKISTSFVSEGGWALEIKKLPDLNQNGLNEFALYYSGGLHQGEGGTGVDIWEFSGTNLKGIGWFQAENFNEHLNTSYKVSVKTGKKPIFYREKYESIEDTKLKKIGKTTNLKLGAIACKFSILR